jgi:hypothetical protein
MLSTIAVLAVLTTAVAIYRAGLPWRANEDKLGWMSAQWLAEQRASTPS